MENDKLKKTNSILGGEPDGELYPISRSRDNKFQSDSFQ
jgi:hypothetical protein